MKATIDTQREQLLQSFPHLWPLSTRMSRNVASIASAKELVTIVITCKNKSSTLPSVLQRIAEQTRRPDMVVLADDASTDRSVGMFIDLCRQHKLPWRLAALPMGGNYRLNTIRNKGFQRSLDGLVMLIDGDLVLSNVYVERHLELHRLHAYPIATMGPRFEYATDERTGPINFMWGCGPEQQGVGPDGFLPAWQRAHGAMCVTKSVWLSLGGFDESYNGKYGIDDIDFLFRLFLAGVYPISNFEAFCIHIPHETGFEGGGRDPRGNIGYFCEKYGVPQTILWDPVDYSPLQMRHKNWSIEFEQFARRHGLSA